MDSTRISIERVLELDVPVIWREAAAVLCEAVSAVRRAGGFSDERPRAASCLVTRGGEVVLADEMARARPESLVALASNLLETCAEPDRFGEALQSGAFLEFVDDFASRTSPNQRRVAIAALALRALAAEADLSLARSSEAGTPAVAHRGVDSPMAREFLAPPGPEKPMVRVRFRSPSPPARPAPVVHRRRTGLRVAVVAAMALAIAAGTWSWPLVMAGPGKPPALPDVSPQAPAPAPPLAAEGEPVTPPLAAAPAESDIVDSGAPAPADIPPPVAPLSTETAVAPAPVAPTRAPAPPMRSDPAIPLREGRLDDPIFTSDSSEVEPPVLVSQVSRDVRVLGPSDRYGRPALEVLVDRAGRVELVRLIGVVGKLSDRQQALVDAARRWQFIPAQRDGQSVRYNARLAVAP